MHTPTPWLAAHGTQMAGRVAQPPFAAVLSSLLLTCSWKVMEGGVLSLGSGTHSPAGHLRLAVSSRTRQLRKSSKPSWSSWSAYLRTTSCRRGVLSWKPAGRGGRHGRPGRAPQGATSGAPGLDQGRELVSPRRPWLQCNMTVCLRRGDTGEPTAVPSEFAKFRVLALTSHPP